MLSDAVDNAFSENWIEHFEFWPVLMDYLHDAFPEYVFEWEFIWHDPKIITICYKTRIDGTREYVRVSHCSGANANDSRWTIANYRSWYARHIP